jgi:hypothetical protein
VLILNREEILKWSIKHNNDNPSGIAIEKELGDKLRSTKTLTKDDLLKIIKWKFFGLPWFEKYTNYVSVNVKDAELREGTYKIFTQGLADNSAIQGIKSVGLKGNATVSVILTFFNPEKYGVFDRHLWQGLYGDRPSKFFRGKFYSDASYYLEVLERLRKDAINYGLPVRTIEKAYFKRHFDEKKSNRRAGHCMR